MRCLALPISFRTSARLPGGRSRPPHGVCGIAGFPGRCKHRPAGGPGGRLAFIRCHPLPAAMPPSQARQNKAALKGKPSPLPLRAAFYAAALFAGRRLCHGISGKATALLMDRIRPKALSPVCRGVPLSRPVRGVCGRAASRSAGKARSAPRLRPARPAAPRRWRAAGPGRP